MRFRNIILIIILKIFFLHYSLGQTLPLAYDLGEGRFEFNFWNENSVGGSYPDHFILKNFSKDSIPASYSIPDSDWSCNYNLKSGSRFTGRNENGLGIFPQKNIADSTACINGSRLGRAGAVLLHLNASGREEIELLWTVSLIQNALETPYILGGFYSLDSGNTWIELANSHFFSKNNLVGEEKNIAIQLPENCNNRESVLIQWKCYSETGIEEEEFPAFQLKSIIVESKEWESGEVEFGINELDIQSFSTILNTGALTKVLKIQGKNLDNQLNISIDEPFKISLDEETGFAGEIEVPTINGSFDSFPVYIRFSPTEPGSTSKQLSIRYASGQRFNKLIKGNCYPKVYINELLAANSNNIKDNSGSNEDWVEIYNPNDFQVNLSSYYATDNPENTNKFQLKNSNSLIIEPQSFLILWASDELARGVQHLSFKFSATEGEHFALYAPDGALVIDSISFGPQTSDISFGRKTDANIPWVLFPSPTPLASNNDSPSNTGVLAPPIFSHKAGYYNEPFDLKLSSNEAGVRIIYTLDGSEPDPDNLNGTTFLYKKKYPRNPLDPLQPLFVSQPYESFVYNQPIAIYNRSSEADKLTGVCTMVEAFPELKVPKNPVYKVNVVRAKCIKQGEISSETITQTYIVDSNRVYSEKLPLISIVTTPSNLFDYDKGIYVPGIDYDNWRIRDTISGYSNGRPANYTRRGANAEILGNFEFFEDTIAATNYKVGIRIHGNWSRSGRVKSLRVYARDKYGNASLSYPFFQDIPYYEFNNILLRNSGNDWQRTYFRDGFIQELIKHHNIEVQGYRPSVLFINGEYWGLINIRERQDEDYLNSKFDANPSKLDIIGPNLSVISGNRIHYDSLLNYIQQNGTYTEENYQYLNTQMDINNYIDYQISRIYVATLDWPGNNIKFWRSKTEKFEPDAPEGLDGRWRWMFYDADSGFGYEAGPEGYKHNTLVWAIDSLLYGNPNATFLMRNMMRNERFKNEFATRSADLMNTTFKAERVESFLMQCKSRIEEEIKQHILRWGDPVAISQWNGHVNLMKVFGNERAKYLRQHFVNYYQFPGVYQLTLDVSDISHGYISVNTIKINPKTPGVDLIPYPWEGEYFKTLPVKMSAKAYHGFLFNRWELKDSISYYPEITINPDSDSFYAKAIFIEDTLYRYVPEPYVLANCPFAFTEWKGAAEKGTYPDNMIFVYMNYDDPRINAEIDSFTFGNYNSGSKTRINGLSEDGVAFINTGNDNPGYPATRVGGAILSLNTQNIEGATLSWKAGTVTPGSLVYHIRLQYRIGDEGDFMNLTDENGNIIEYKRNEIAGHSEQFGPIKIPPKLMNKECVQLFFKYYFTGLKLDEKSTIRDQLRIDDIIVGQVPMDTILQKAEYETILQANQNGISYDWYRCVDDTLLPLESDRKYQFNITQAGNYAVAIQYDGCVDTSGCFYAFVKEKLGIRSSITAIVSPNPVKDILNINFPEYVRGGFWATITDIQGRVVQTNYFSDGYSFKMNTNGLSAGVYILSLTNQEDLNLNLKFIRQ